MEDFFPLRFGRFRKNLRVYKKSRTIYNCGTVTFSSRV